VGRRFPAKTALEANAFAIWVVIAAIPIVFVLYVPQDCKSLGCRKKAPTLPSVRSRRTILRFSKSRNKKERKGGGGKVMWVAATTHKSYQIAAATCKMANGSLHKISSNLQTGGKILLFS
jgi:hypothetical protein